MRSPVCLKVAEAIRADLGEFAERWIRFLRANELVPDTDDPLDEAINRARLGFEVLANLLEGADYEKFENVISRLLHDWINRAATWSDLQAIETVFPAFLLPHLELDNESDEVQTIRNALTEFLNSEIRARFMSDYLGVYEEIIGSESRHTAYILAHFDSILALTAHLNGAETREEIIDGLALSIRDLFENVLGIAIWSETPDGLILKTISILDEDIPTAFIDPDLPSAFLEAFEIDEVKRIPEEHLPESIKPLINVEAISGLTGVAIPIRPRESDGLLVLILIGSELTGTLELSLCRIAAAETALALDRAGGRARVISVNRRIRDILLLSRETGWGSRYRETGELVLEYLTDLTGARRTLLLSSSLSGSTSESLLPRASRDVPDEILDFYRSGNNLSPLVRLSVKGKRILLLTSETLAEILAGRKPPEGFEPSGQEALGILPLTRKGSFQAVCLFLCPATFAMEQESMDLLGVFAGIAADNLATAREYERSLVVERIAEADTARARTLQAQLAPRFRRSGKIVFWSSLQAACELAGDVTVVQIPTDGRLDAWTADVAGRGPSAAWSMMFLRQLLTELPQVDDSPRSVLEEMNSRLHEIESAHKAGGSFTTSIGLSIDEKKRIARFACAGAPKLFRVTSDGRVERYDPEGLPLGIFPDAGIDEAEIPFEPGDKLVWASDGFYTARNDEGDFFGEKRLLLCINKAGFLPTRALYERILADFGDFGVEDSAADDRSLLVIGHCGKPDWSRKHPGAERDTLLDEALEFISGSGISDREFGAVRLLLDEAIKNANEHGNRGDPNADIEVRITHSPRFIHLAVRDEGGKLNERVTAPTLRADTLLEDKGRGFLLMRHQADHLWVEDDRGELNAVRLLEGPS